MVNAADIQYPYMVAWLTKPKYGNAADIPKDGNAADIPVYGNYVADIPIYSKSS